MRILQTTELKKYYGTEPDITRALDGVTLSIETLQTFITGIDTPFAEGGTAFLRRTFLRFFFFVCILVFCLSAPDNMSRIRSVAKE